jgi:hypothetical protein
VIKGTTLEEYERLLIKSLFANSSIPLVSQFGDVSIKERIEKLNQHEPGGYKKMKLVTLIPLVGLLVLACATYDDVNPDIPKSLEGTVVRMKDGATLPGIIVTALGTSTKTVTDIYGKYKIEVPVGIEYLEFSFLGVKTQKIPISNHFVIDATLEMSHL